MSDPTQKRSGLSRLAPLLAILALLAAGAFAYYKTSGVLDANGTWYGPTRATSGAVTVSVETYLNISTSLTGQFSGKGTFCLALPFNNTATVDFTLTGQHEFVFYGHDPQPDVTLTVEEAVPLVAGFSLPIGPNLKLHGSATPTRLRLTGGDSHVVAAADLRHGTRAAFTTACRALAPLG
jgi:hypothetical protein